jgi:hypothetical protein
MNKEFIPYDLAIQFRELGFDEECIGFYNIHLDVIPIDSEPYTTKSIDGSILYQQAFKWFREKYQLYAWIKVEYEYGGVTPTFYITGKRQEDIAGGAFETFEEAELACLKKLIEIVKNK